MRFHTVKCGESIFDIARQYSAAPSKIIEENEIDAERLVAGEELLILTPTRSVTVRGGNTLLGICRRFDVKKQSLILANPRLCADERIYPGQILTVKQSAPALGTASSLGFFRRGCSYDKLTRVLPYLTYVAICSAEIKGERVYPFFRDTNLLSLVKRRGKVPLLAIKDTTNGEFLKKPECTASLIDSMTALAKNGYKGIYLELDGNAYDGKRICDFLLEARKRFLGCDLILFTEVKSESAPEWSDISDGTVLFPDGKRERLERFAEESESGKTLVALKTEAMTEDGISMDIKSALHVAYRAGSSIERVGNECKFLYKKYRSGEAREVSVRYPSLEKIYEHMKDSARFGYMGFAFDISTVPVSYLCIINSGFRRADYSLLSGAEI